MRIKRDLLKKLVRKLPLGASTCYFCRKYEMSCYACEYGKVHGKCVKGNRASGEIGIIYHARDILHKTLDCYYSSEEYDTPLTDEEIIMANIA